MAAQTNMRNCRPQDWDFTSSDMSRYQLSSAEQLRRQLLRISKHQDQAAVQVQRKLRSMQENIAPFLDEWQPCQETGSSPTPAPKNVAAWAFASRVPTGRLPETFDVDRPGEAPVTRQDGNSARAHRFGDRPASATGARRVHMPESAKPRAHDRDEDLESEIERFFADADHGVTQSSASRPKYKLLRAKTSAPPRAARTPGPTIAQSPDSSPSAAESDVELGEIEEEAGALEAQLAWWRSHEAVLMQKPCWQPYGEPADQPACDEIAGHSEFLRLSSGQLLQMEEPSLENGVAPVRMPDLPNFAPEPRAGKLDATESCCAGSSKGASIHHFGFGESLSEVVGRQADDLMSTLLRADRDREVTFGRPEAHSSAPVFDSNTCNENTSCPAEPTMPMPLRATAQELPTLAQNTTSSLAVSSSEPASPALAPRDTSGQASLDSCPGSPAGISRRTPRVVVSRSDPETPPTISWQRATGSPSSLDSRTASLPAADPEARGFDGPTHPNADPASEVPLPPAKFPGHLLDGRGSSLPRVHWCADLDDDDAQMMRTGAVTSLNVRAELRPPAALEFPRQPAVLGENLGPAVLRQQESMQPREDNVAKAALELARGWAAELDSKREWETPLGAKSVSSRAACGLDGTMPEKHEFAHERDHRTSQQFGDSTTPTKGFHEDVAKARPTREVGSFGASLQAPKLQIRSFDDLFNI